MCVSRIADLLVVHLVERLEAVERRAADLARHAGRIVDVEDRIAGRAERSRPRARPADSPLDHSRAEIACTCSVFVGRATSTTNVGRLSLSEPRPYDAHAPEARPAGHLVAGLHVA